MLSVKGNQQNLRKRCKELPWRDIPILDRSSGKPAHGRLETRTLQATEIDAGIGFPGAVQVVRINRTGTVLSRRRGLRNSPGKRCMW